MNKIPELDLQQCLSISNLLGIIIEESYEQDQSTAFDCRENERFVVRKYNGEYKLFDNNAEAETYFILQINECYTKLLKLADEQGLLTKEASLALKPDNYIEWDFIKGDASGYAFGYSGGIQDKWVGKNKHFTFNLCLDTHVSDNYQEVKMLISVFNKFNDKDDIYKKPIPPKDYNIAKQYCQNWLDEKLKG